METKLAVFTTTEIFRHSREPSDEEPRARGPNGYKCYTRGTLERALEEGYEVIVVTSRYELLECDNWWKALVPEGNIYLTSDDPEMEHNAKFNEPWKKLYERLGLQYPMNPYLPTQPVFWPEAREQLKNHGIKRGIDFRTPTQE